MIQDKELLFSDGQALTATADSTNVHDLVTAFDMASGEKLVWFLHCDVALAGTTPTLDISLVTSADSGLGTPTTIIAHPQLTALAVGSLIQYVLPPGDSITWLQYVGVIYTLGGTTPTVTLTSGIVKDSEVLRAYPDARSLVA